MTITTTSLYGAFTESSWPFVDQYGVLEDKYGVVPDPILFGHLLTESGNSLVQENRGSILVEPASLGSPGMIGSTFIIGVSALA